LATEGEGLLGKPLVATRPAPSILAQLYSPARLAERPRSVWRRTVGDTKTEKSKAPQAVIPQLAQRLEAHRKRCGNPPGGPTLANTVGHPLDLNACYQREMKDVLKRGGLLWHGWHGFRSGLVSNLNRLGEDDSVLQRILRHSNRSNNPEPLLQDRIA
jgi:hypothetical protein